jgi:hypothetical protein
MEAGTFIEGEAAANVTGKVRSNIPITISISMVLLIITNVASSSNPLFSAGFLSHFITEPAAPHRQLCKFSVKLRLSYCAYTDRMLYYKVVYSINQLFLPAASPPGSILLRKYLLPHYSAGAACGMVV